MKKKVIFFIIIVSVCLFVYTNSNMDKVIISNEKTKQMINSNALTMMYEITSGSGEYEVSSDTSWPQEGYIFNEELSSCENGGKLSWNSETKRVVMQSNSSDK